MLVKFMEQSINAVTSGIASILHGSRPSVFLLGSAVLDDFKLGSSDIDILCLTEEVIRPEQAEKLVNLRRTLSAEKPENPYFKLFEGVMLTLNAFLCGSGDVIVYWGTSGQRILSNYEFCPLCRIVLLEHGKCLYGSDLRHLIPYPDRAEIIAAIKKHCNTIRQHGKSGGGWLLDIARCLYTLRTGKIISKTKAGEWAIGENICPDAEAVKYAVEMRKNPLEFKHRGNISEAHIQKFADVLKAELYSQ